ncbi:polyphosphoinositide phosphatase [Striga asiatica]|uniref:Polyphosphoinositide phosphatase n=1 Tax=Striga asiatica TaxID=4170 RepID=A0A5A7R4M5_STRAF|nr:polyphosphoinositide phosphatase [Striga asiatica]
MKISNWKSSKTLGVKGFCEGADVVLAGFGNPPLYWSKDDSRPPETLHLGSHCARSRAKVTQEMVTQYASPSVILKICLYRVTRGNLNGISILREIVFVVSNSDVPQVMQRNIRLA